MLLPLPGPRLKQDAYGAGKAAADRKNLDQNASARTAEPSHQGPRQQRPEAKRSTLPAGGKGDFPERRRTPGSGRAPPGIAELSYTHSGAGVRAAPEER